MASLLDNYLKNSTYERPAEKVLAHRRAAQHVLGHVDAERARLGGARRQDRRGVRPGEGARAAVGDVHRVGHRVVYKDEMMRD